MNASKSHYRKEGEQREIFLGVFTRFCRCLKGAFCRKSPISTGRSGRLTITLKMAARNFLPRCIAFYNRIPIDSLTIPNSNAMHLGKKFLAAIFSVIVY